MDLHVLAGIGSLVGLIVGISTVIVLTVYDTSLRRHLNVQSLWWFVLFSQLCALALGLYSRQDPLGKIGAIGAGITLIFLLILSVIYITPATPG